MGLWVDGVRQHRTQHGEATAAAASPRRLAVSFCVAPWELWRKIAQRPDAPSGALELVEATPFVIHRQWREPRGSSLRQLAVAAGSTEDAVKVLEWMVSSGQARWDGEEHAVVLSHLVWLRESGLAAAYYERDMLVLGDNQDAMAHNAATCQAGRCDGADQPDLHRPAPSMKEPPAQQGNPRAVGREVVPSSVELRWRPLDHQAALTFLSSHAALTFSVKHTSSAACSFGRCRSGGCGPGWAARPAAARSGSQPCPRAGCPRRRGGSCPARGPARSAPPRSRA
jgi:hypothetical protein